MFFIVLFPLSVSIQLGRTRPNEAPSPPLSVRTRFVPDRTNVQGGSCSYGGNDFGKSFLSEPEPSVELVGPSGAGREVWGVRRSRTDGPDTRGRDAKSSVRERVPCTAKTRFAGALLSVAIC